MKSNKIFKGRHFAKEAIILNMRWYLIYPLSYRNLEEMNLDRNFKVDHTTIYRWVQKYAPELEQRVRPHLRKGGISYRIDETYIKIKGIWHFLYRAIDSYGDAIDFMLSPKRNASEAFRFFRKMTARIKLNLLILCSELLHRFSFHGSTFCSEIKFATEPL